jgi:hypothetical protein
VVVLLVVRAVLLMVDMALPSVLVQWAFERDETPGESPPRFEQRPPTAGLLMHESRAGLRAREGRGLRLACKRHLPMSGDTVVQTLRSLTVAGAAPD